MELLGEYFTPWIISNSIAILVLVAAIKNQNWLVLQLARLFDMDH